MDATLRALVVNDGSTDLTLTPDFASSTIAYMASVVNAVDEVTVTPTKNDAGARIEYLDASDMPLDDADSAAGHQVAVAEGDTVIKVKVTAEDGSMTRFYTVTVTRSALPTLSVADASAVEGSAVMFTVTLSKAATQNLTASWTASLETGDTAAAADFTDLPAATGTVTVTANQTTAEFMVATAQDTTDEENETFTVTLSNLSNPSNAELAADPTATGTITDDDEAMTTLSVADASAREGDEATFTVTLSAVSGRAVTVGWWTAVETGDTAESGSDFKAAFGDLTIAAGETKGTITVSTKHDRIGEPDETFTLMLSNPTNATLDGGGTTLKASGTIHDGPVHAVAFSRSQVHIEESERVQVCASIGAPAGAPIGETAIVPIVLHWETVDSPGVAGDFRRSAEPDVDYEVSSGTMTIEAGHTEACVDIPIVNDLELEHTETLWVALRPDDDTLVWVVSSPRDYTIIDVDEAHLSVDVETTVDEGAGSATITVNTGGAFLLFPFSITYETAPGIEIPPTGESDQGLQPHPGYTANAAALPYAAAAAGADYSRTTGTLTIEAGAESGTITVPLIDDRADEERELFHVWFRRVKELDKRIRLPVHPARVVIVDNDPPELSVADASATEGSPVIFTVTLSGAATQNVTANWAVSLETGDTAAVADLTDPAATGTVTVPAGRTTATFAVATAQDTADEGSSYETFTVTLSSPSSNAQLAPDPTARGAINDDDGTALPSMSVTDATANEGEGVEFTVTLSAISAQAVTVDWTATPESGDTAEAADLGSTKTGTATVPAGETTATFTVATAQDTVDEDDETFTVTLSDPTDAALEADPTATGTIIDDDSRPEVRVEDATAGEGDLVEFTVTLSPASGREVKVTAATSIKSSDTAAAGDFSAASATLTFMPGETEKTVPVQTTDDTVDEDDETFTLTLSDPSNATLGRTAKGIIDDDDAVPVASVADATANEGDPVEFTVALSPASGREVKVTAATSIESSDTAAAGDFEATTTRLTFMPGETEKTVTVQTTGDTTDESNETFTLTLSRPSHAMLAADPTATGTIGDDGTANVAPSFTSSATFNPAESRTTVGTVAASDSDTGDDLTGYALSGGADQALFAIDGTTGALTFLTAPDYEAPRDADTDNAYVVEVQATSGTGNRVQTARQTITVTVMNADEGRSGTVSIDDTAPMVGDELTASTADEADPDGLPNPFAPAWQWYRTPAGGSETVISGAASATYTVVEADLGAALTAKASWTDDGGFSNTLASTPTAAVTAPAVSFGAGSYTVDEGGTVEVTVQLDPAPGRAVTVPVSAAGAGGATPPGETGADWSGVPENVTFGATDTAQTFTLAATADTDAEAGESVVLSFGTLPDEVTAGSPSQATVTITANEGASPRPMLSVGDAQATEGGAVTFMVTLSAAGAPAVTVDWTASIESGDTAAAADLGSKTTGTVTFTASDTTATFMVATVQDSTDEDDETFTVTLSSPSSNATLAAESTATGTIGADGDAPPSVSVVADTEASEGGPLEFEVTLSAASGKTVTVDWKAATLGGDTAMAGTDYTDASATLTLMPGEPSKTVTVQTTEDTTGEHRETFTLALSDPSNARLTRVRTATGTITDDDPVVTIAKDKNVVFEEQGNAGFTLSRTGSTAAALTVTVAVTQQEDRDLLPDGAAAQRTVMFAVGSATAALTVTLDDDDLAETTGDLTVEVQAGSGYTVGDPASATVTVSDIDTGLPTPANLRASTGARGGEVALSWDAYAPHLTFARHQYRYKTDGDYPETWIDIPNSGQHDSGAGDGSNLTGYTVTGLVGGRVHTFQVRTYVSPSSAGAASEEAMATPFSLEVSFGAESYSVDEGGTVAVTVHLDAAPGREVVVPVSAAGAGGATPPGETGADWSGVPENVTFGATDTEQTLHAGGDR